MGRRVQTVQTGLDSGSFTLGLYLTNQMNSKWLASWFIGKRTS